MERGERGDAGHSLPGPAVRSLPYRAGAQAAVQAPGEGYW